MHEWDIVHHGSTHADYHYEKKSAIIACFQQITDEHVSGERAGREHLPQRTILHETMYVAENSFLGHDVLRVPPLRTVKAAVHTLLSTPVH